MFCNLETRPSPFYAVFTPRFRVMYGRLRYMVPGGPRLHGGSNTNSTCAGVHFVPLWSNKTVAFGKNARGNCFLKPGPQNRTALKAPSMGTMCHSGILVKLK